MLSLRIPAVCAVLMALTVPAVAGAATPAPKLQKILDASVKTGGFPGVAMHVRLADGTTWSGAAGKANLATGRPLRSTDRIRAGSILKPFVAAATLQLVEQGKLSLDATLPSLLPTSVTARFPQAGQITVRMLLNHTSGLAEWSTPESDLEAAADPRRIWTTDEFLDRSAALPATGAPGERWSYSNTNYNLLGLILERVTGQPWRTVIRERVIRPLKLTHTTLPEPGTRVRGNIVHGYMPIDGRLVEATDVDTSMAGAAGGQAMVTSTADLSRFVHALLTGRLFEHRSTLTAMRTSVTATDEHGLIGYGLGLERYRLPGGVELIGHLGGTGGYLTLMLRVPEQNVDMVITINQPGDIASVLMPALEAVLRR